MLDTAVNITPHFQGRVNATLEDRDRTLACDAILPSPPSIPQLLNVTGVARSSNLLTVWELEITENYDATALVDLLASRKITAVAILAAFRKRATIAQQLTNCLTELIPDAVQWAQAADDYIKKTGETLGPLHGLPISLKEQIGISNRRTNAAFVSWVDNITERDANLVTSLKSLGAIVFARTTQPQSFMHVETSSNIYGVTVNPRNKLLTSGGSSGGEAALMVLHGTPLGFGGDIGGSIRAPASQNGLWGFKPSVGRYSGLGVVVPWPGCDSIHGTLGPFCRSLRDIDLVQAAYSSTKPWLNDPSILPCPVSIAHAPALDRKLRVGIMATDGVVEPLPPVQLIIQNLTKKLEKSPLIEICPFAPLQHDKAWQIISANYFEDGGETIKAICAESGEGLRPLTTWIIEECKRNEQIIANTLQGRKAARDAFRELYSAHWNAAGVDVVIAPTGPSVAAPLNSSRYWTYTAIWNLLDYPGIAFPASDMLGGYSADLRDMPYTPSNKMEEDIFEHYDPDIAQHMPIGLQVVAKKWQDSECLAAAKIIEQELQS